MARKKPTPRYVPNTIGLGGYSIMAGIILLAFIGVIFWGD